MRDRATLNSVHFLRFVAALAVVLHHATTIFGSKILVGASGVDVFFVISGIVIGLTISNGNSPTQFALKRVIRVLPLYWLSTAIYVLLTYLWWSKLPTGETLFRSFFFWPKFGTDFTYIYFPAWTLGYEMFFYAAATAALFLFRARARAACILVCIVLALMKIPVPLSGGTLYFATNMFLEFAGGMIIAVLIERGLIVDRTVGAFCIAAAIVLFWVGQYTGVIRPISWGAPAVLLVIGMLSFEDAGWLKSGWVKVGGDASYAMYLFHITVFDIINYQFQRARIDLREHFWPTWISLSIIAVIVGILVSRFIEAPILKVLRSALLRKGKRPAQSIPTDMPIA